MNPVVFLDFAVGGAAAGRVQIELLPGLPRTTENFRQFCTGEHRRHSRPVGYKNCAVHRIVRGASVHTGDWARGNGTGAECIHGGQRFADEGFPYNHDKYSVSMANTGPNSNGSQFFICTAPAPHLDGKHVVFGKVVAGFDVVDRLDGEPTGRNDVPVRDIRICECGEM